MIWCARCGTSWFGTARSVTSRERMISPAAKSATFGGHTKKSSSKIGDGRMDSGPRGWAAPRGGWAHTYAAAQVDSVIRTTARNRFIATTALR
ncbi:hypothetical protein MLGJGCBP_01219 [Rhodococcus sp. T7]|nr:hypothetical protein MLGJGCBP_01219 [Rhodococcus sp. T7]